jgi:hypothetical protein
MQRPRRLRLQRNDTTLAEEHGPCHGRELEVGNARSGRSCRRVKAEFQLRQRKPIIPRQREGRLAWVFAFPTIVHFWRAARRASFPPASSWRLSGPEPPMGETPKIAPWTLKRALPNTPQIYVAAEVSDQHNFSGKQTAWGVDPRSVRTRWRTRFYAIALSSRRIRNRGHRSCRARLVQLRVSVPRRWWRAFRNPIYHFHTPVAETRSCDCGRGISRTLEPSLCPRLQSGGG